MYRLALNCLFFLIFVVIFKNLKWKLVLIKIDTQPHTHTHIPLQRNRLLAPPLCHTDTHTHTHKQPYELSPTGITKIYVIYGEARKNLLLQTQVTFSLTLFRIRLLS